MLLIQLFWTGPLVTQKIVSRPHCERTSSAIS